MALTIPRSVDDITPEWLGAALEEGGLDGVRVAEVSKSTIGAGQGFMGQLSRLAVRYHEAPEDAPPSLVAKLPTLDPGGRQMGEMLQVWERESRFYDEVAPHIELRVPRCYLNARAEGDYVLLLEDLAPLQAADQLAGATPEQSRRVIEELAGFHATWWDDPRLDGFDWMPRVDGPLAGLIQPMFEAGWPQFLERYRDRVPSETLAWAENFAGRVPEWMAEYGDEPCAITHGDFRLDNMLFGPDGEFALLDWQMSMRSPGLADVVYFIATNLTEDVRRACDLDLIRLYRDRLHERGITGSYLEWDSLMKGFHQGLVFFTVMMGSGLHQIDPANPRGEALFDALVMRSFSAAAERDAGKWL